MERAIPLLHEEEWPRHKQKMPRSLRSGADGVVEHADTFRPARPPRLRRQEASRNLLGPHPALLVEEGTRSHFAGCNSFTPSQTAPTSWGALFLSCRQLQL